MTLAAYTGPTPPTGYVGYVNLTLRDGAVVFTVRSQNADGSGTASYGVPIEGARAMLQHALRQLADQYGGNTRETDEAATVRFINDLRGHEGDSVTILCNNPDFNGQPNCAILCNGEWTDYDDLRFKGDTVLQCLARASIAKNDWHQAEARTNRHD